MYHDTTRRSACHSPLSFSFPIVAGVVLIHAPPPPPPSPPSSHDFVHSLHQELTSKHWKIEVSCVAEKHLVFHRENELNYLNSK